VGVLIMITRVLEVDLALFTSSQSIRSKVAEALARIVRATPFRRIAGSYESRYPIEYNHFIRPR